jgi:hypothetical protein
MKPRLLSTRRALWRLLAACVPLLLWAAVPGAAAQPAGRAEFDHLRTGFALVGPHAQARCEACHTGGTFKGTPRDCAACHVAGQRLARANVVMPPQHLPTQRACDQCHRPDTFAGVRFNHAGVPPGGCASCHTPGSGRGKPAGHLQTTASCDRCHRTNAWLPATGFDHSGFTAATQCASCHNGGTATGKGATHVPVAALNCIACHTTARWRPSSFNHTQLVVTAQCAGCHSGAYPPADGRGANHVPYAAVPVAAAANCDACHKGSVVSWANGRFHANFSVANGCFTCHTGTWGGAVGKPANATHATVAGGCESCHGSTASWTSNVTFAHTPANAVGSGSCDTCHNGSTAKGKHAGHVPVNPATAKCDGCHRSQSAWTTAVTMNHAVVAATACKTCHNGAYTGEGATGALAKPANHVPEAQLLNGAAMDCNACHSGTTVWTSVRMNHNNSPGNGAGWCKACHQSGTAWLGSLEKKALTHEKSTGVTDCSQAGCHRPLGTRGAAYTAWD